MSCAEPLYATVDLGKKGFLMTRLELFLNGRQRRCPTDVWVRFFKSETGSTFVLLRATNNNTNKPSLHNHFYLKMRQPQVIL